MKKVCLVLLCFSACAGSASAQDVDNEKYVGVGARLRPAYDGADTNRVDAVPFVRFFGEHFFARTTQGILEGGWRTRPFGNVTFGAQLSYEEGRQADESAFLSQHHFDDINRSVAVGVHAEGNWNLGPVPFNALLRLRKDIKSDNGAQADLRATAGILDWHGVRAGVFGQITWSDDKYTRRFYGITPSQSATTGLPTYDAGAGARFFQTGLLGDVNIAKHWIGLWGVAWQQLQGDAVDSPITQQHSNWIAGAGLAYRF
jgi:MipA family protein